jgi:hypothetical protein
MPPKLVPRVESLGVGALEPLHARDKISPRRLQQQMVVISHQDVGMDQPPRLLRRLPQTLEKCLPVRIVAKNQVAVVTSAHHMINRSGILNSQRARHVMRVLALTLPVSIHQLSDRDRDRRCRRPLPRSDAILLFSDRPLFACCRQSE